MAQTTDNNVVHTTSPQTGTIRVGVYGSLRSGFHNHCLLEDGSVERLGMTTVSAELGFGMVSLGSFPAVHRTDDAATELTLEVYTVDEDVLHSLDCLEGHPSWYKREKVKTADFKNVWVYVMQDDVSGHAPVTTGDWADYMEAV